MGKAVKEVGQQIEEDSKKGNVAKREVKKGKVAPRYRSSQRAKEQQEIEEVKRSLGSHDYAADIGSFEVKGNDEAATEVLQAKPIKRVYSNVKDDKGNIGQSITENGSTKYFIKDSKGNTTYYADESFSKKSYSIDGEGKKTEYSYAKNKKTGHEFMISSEKEGVTTFYTEGGTKHGTLDENKNAVFFRADGTKKGEQHGDGSSVSYFKDGKTPKLVIDKEGNATRYTHKGEIKYQMTPEKEVYVSKKNGDKVFYKDSELKEVSYNQTKEGKIYTQDDKGNKTFYTDKTLKKVDHEEKNTPVFSKAGKER